MMRLARRASMLVAFSLLTSAATAYAECAWVLWTHAEGNGAEFYRVELARPTRSACDAVARSYIRVLKEDGFSVSGGMVADSEVIGHKGTERVRYFCLPDAIDPRGPKGR